MCQLEQTTGKWTQEQPSSFAHGSERVAVQSMCHSLGRLVLHVLLANCKSWVRGKCL